MAANDGSLICLHDRDYDTPEVLKTPPKERKPPVGEKPGPKELPPPGPGDGGKPKPPADGGMKP